jgi:hypothetical protein
VHGKRILAGKDRREAAKVSGRNRTERRRIWPWMADCESEERTGTAMETWEGVQS